MNEINKKAWAYFLNFTGETPETTSKCVKEVQPECVEKTWLELREQLLNGKPYQCITDGEEYLLLLDHKARPSLILKAQPDGFCFESDVEA